MRFLITALVIMAFLTLFIAIVFYLLGITVTSQTIRISYDGREASEGIREISFTDSGARIETKSGELYATSLVPANQLWVNTNIDVAPGSRVRLAATGSVDLALSTTLRMIDRPDEHNMQWSYHLVGPRGERLYNGQPRERPADNLRDPIKLVRGVRLGTLVGIVASEDDLEREVQPDPSRVFTLRSAHSTSEGYTYTGRRIGRLFLAVNDLVWIDAPQARDYWLLRRRPDGSPFSEPEVRRNIREAYLPATATEAQITERVRWAQERWDTLTAMQYRNAFFDDNSGFYMVSISVAPPSED